MSGPLELDPHWEWFEITALGDREPRYIKGRCKHLDVVPVDLVTGDIVAQLCLTCDTQLPPPGTPDSYGTWMKTTPVRGSWRDKKDD